MAKPLILVTNDDGITSKGIKVLIEEMSKIGEVYVMAPDSPNSGMGHAITVDSTLHIKKSPIFGEIESFECSGTPADCVKMAKHEFLKGRKIDLLVSGINHGLNSSISVIYSGTMSAAIEGAIEGIPSVGFSLDDFRYDADFEHTRPYLKQIAEFVLKNGVPKGTALNVNFPKNSDVKIKGIKLCRQTNGYWQEEFDARKDPHGRPYYWMGGHFVNREPESNDNDIWALENNYISVVPCHYDLTSYAALEELSKTDIES
ncbi:5'/3'-nucleotidase SurE [Lacihabitans sp. LS3-19]|uniref:5'/3'-nucleotidase SurE n=1 Tax=Lacihabitans sp. LS3-19 TaxID=2487335 RepID=UPI0020CEF51F|nr:5'/3'-nucleotidase SurE [Lacihabitans sp. LS3-19]MCP9768138.1 5'/3'-nucleotidase SurE [Lacihabitans sp. LS3-19]